MYEWSYTYMLTYAWMIRQFSLLKPPLKYHSESFFQPAYIFLNDFLHAWYYYVLYPV